MFGKLGDMAGMMKKAQEMQKNMASTQEELSNTEVKGGSANGEIEIAITCDMIIQRINIKQECLDANDKEILEALLLDATNNAISTAKQKTQEKMSELTGGLNIPGL